MNETFYRRSAVSPNSTSGHCTGERLSAVTRDDAASKGGVVRPTHRTALQKGAWAHDHHASHSALKEGMGA